MIRYVFTDLPKFSLNQRYSGHWADFHEIKKAYRLIMAPKVKKLTFKCDVKYVFEFRRNPLDNTNCISMIKVIEDIIWPNDAPNIVRTITIESFKSPRHKDLLKKKIDMVVTILIQPIEDETEE